MIATLFITYPMEFDAVGQSVVDRGLVRTSGMLFGGGVRVLKQARSHADLLGPQTHEGCLEGCPENVTNVTRDHKRTEGCPEKWRYAKNGREGCPERK